jgi:hypothetical protein
LKENYKHFKIAPPKKMRNTIETDELNLQRKVRLLENQKDQPKREQRAREKAAREAAKLTQTALKPQPLTSRTHMDIYTAATNETSGLSESGQQGAVDADVETVYKGR